MSKRLFVLMCLVVTMALGSTWVVAGQGEGEEAGDTMCLPMGTISLHPPESVEAKRSPVDFPHAQHFAYDCRECHHKWVGTEQIQNCTTSGCHDLTISPLKAEDPEVKALPQVRYYKKAYHQNCIVCHRDIKAENKKLEMAQANLDSLKKTGPTGCKECHPTD